MSKKEIIGISLLLVGLVVMFFAEKNMLFCFVSRIKIGAILSLFMVVLSVMLVFLGLVMLGFQKKISLMISGIVTVVMFFPVLYFGMFAPRYMY